MDGGLLTRVLNDLISMCGTNGVVKNGVDSLLNLLVPIDFCFAILVNMMSFGGNGYLPLMFSKIMRYGFWIWIVRNWDMLINTLIQSLTQAGAGFGNLDAGIVSRPSQILNMGFNYCSQYFDMLNRTPFEIGTIGKSLVLWVVALIAAIGIFVAFAYIALNAFITYIEFYIVSALLLLFIPFAVNDRTARYAENAMGFIVGTGVKLMLMAAIISLAHSQYELLGSEIDLNLDNNGKSVIGWQDAFSATVLAWIFAFLAVQVPALAAGAMSGAPSLTGSMAQSAAVGAAATMGGAIGASMGGGGSLAKGGSFVAGAFKAGAAATVKDNEGVSSPNPTGGGFSGGLKGMAHAMGNYASKGMQDTYDMGKAASSRPFGQYHQNSGNLGTKDDALKTTKA